MKWNSCAKQAFSSLLAGRGNMFQAQNFSERPIAPAVIPPAPKPQAHTLGPIALMRTLRRNPLECFAAEHFERPIASGGLPFGHVLLVHEPAAIRRVLLENASNYQKDRLQRRVLSAGLGEGLLSAEGEKWRIQRHILAPMFARKTVMGFGSAMTRAADALIDRWSDLGDPVTLDIAAEMAKVTLDVLERTIFSDGFRSDAEAIRVAMTTYFNTIGKINSLDLLGVPDFVPRFSRLRVRSTLKFFEGEVDKVISDRRRVLATRPDDVPDDLLTHLLLAVGSGTGDRITEAESRSNILTFIAAGHETTANSLTWAMFLLSQSEDWRRRVEVEVDRELTGKAAEVAADRLVETRAVIEEAIRLYPPIAAISRVALDYDNLGGEQVRPGTLIVISPYVLHRHHLLWHRPNEFDPARFLGAERSRIDRFAYLPFGVGPRKCIGFAFALQEATLVLATIAKHFSFDLSPGHTVWPMLKVTLRPEKGLPMIVRKRRANLH
jgi:cytochrome P450